MVCWYVSPTDCDYNPVLVLPPCSQPLRRFPCWQLIYKYWRNSLGWRELSFPPPVGENLKKWTAISSDRRSSIQQTMESGFSLSWCYQVLKTSRAWSNVWGLLWESGSHTFSWLWALFIGVIQFMSVNLAVFIPFTKAAARRQRWNILALSLPRGVGFRSWHLRADKSGIETLILLLRGLGQTSQSV